MASCYGCIYIYNLYTDASDSQNNHTKVYNIIRMQMTPKILNATNFIATLKFSTAAYRVVVSTDHIRLNT